jgi:hypothetical protein
VEAARSLDPQPDAEPVEAERPQHVVGPRRSRGHEPAEQREEVRMVAVEVPENVGLDGGQRVGPGGEEVRRTDVGAVAVLAQDHLGEVEPHQGGRAADVEQHLGGADVGKFVERGPFVARADRREPAGQPQLGTYRIPQRHRRPVAHHHQRRQVGRRSAADGGSQVAVPGHDEQGLPGGGHRVRQHPTALDAGGADGGRSAGHDRPGALGRARAQPLEILATVLAFRFRGRAARAGRHGALLSVVRQP